MKVDRILRRKTRTVKAGSCFIGGNSPVSVQSMTKTDTRDVKSTVAQIKTLEKAGCEIIRCAVADIQAAKSLGKIKSKISIPLVADIHFDWRLAVEAIAQGVDKIRINPSNIGSYEKIAEIVKQAKNAGIPIRIGVNAGSLKPLRSKKIMRYSKSELMVRNALEYIELFEKLRFRDIIISLKASDVNTTITAYSLIGPKIDYPLHLGITEAGTNFSAMIKSSVGMGSLLSQGIGDTIRVSLTGDGVDEVKIAREILRSLGLRQFGPEIISCPTCGRCEIDLIHIAQEVEKYVTHISERRHIKPLKIAVMGCVVNGPGEAREADVGIAGASGGYGILFKKGKLLKKVPEKILVKALISEIKKMVQ